MVKASIQLAFKGQCRQAFEHYEQVLGGKITIMNTFGGNDVPLPPNSSPGPDDQIRFAEIKIGESVLLGNDVPHDEYKPMQGFNVALHVKSAADAKRIFEALSAGGQVDTPLSEVAWSSAFGIVTDRFGVPWLVLALDR